MHLNRHFPKAGTQAENGKALTSLVVMEIQIKITVQCQLKCSSNGYHQCQKSTCARQSEEPRIFLSMSGQDVNYNSHPERRTYDTKIPIPITIERNEISMLKGHLYLCLLKH